MIGLPTAFEDFEWDRGNWSKCQQHGVSIQEIETALAGGAMLILPDIRHSDEEDRLIATGKGVGGRHIFVVITLRRHGGRTLLRPVSARYMHQREIAIYEQARAEVENR
jgi:uncharacterized DUF497 family protein